MFELIPKTEEATQELVEKFFDSFQILKVETPIVETPKVELLREEKKPPKKPKFVKPKTEKEGYDKKKINENAYHDIYNMIKENKIIYLEGTKPKKYKIISRDTSDLG